VRVSGDKATRALIVIEEPALSRFLGDAENPAHSDWSERADKIRTQYDHGAWTLRFVKNSASFLASLLARRPSAASAISSPISSRSTCPASRRARNGRAAVRIPMRTAAGATPTSEGNVAEAGAGREA
jgi:hypothetical protein